MAPEEPTTDRIDASGNTYSVPRKDTIETASSVALRSVEKRGCQLRERL